MAVTDNIPVSYEQWRAAYGLTPERDASFTTLSGEEIAPLYTERDLPAGIGSDDDPIGLPGQYPFTRGVYPSMYRGTDCGRCGSSPGSAPPRRPTSASAICSITARPASRPRSTCRR